MKSSKSIPAPTGGEASNISMVEKEAEVLKLKLEIKEQAEEMGKLEQETEVLKKQNSEITTEFNDKMKEEQAD